jgi:hypothetical protein
MRTDSAQQAFVLVIWSLCLALTPLTGESHGRSVPIEEGATICA